MYATEMILIIQLINYSVTNKSVISHPEVYDTPVRRAPFGRWKSSVFQMIRRTGIEFPVFL
jgi:hypothetical protein